MNQIKKIISAIYYDKEKTIINVKLEHKDYGIIEYGFKANTEDESLDAEIRKLLKDFSISPYVEKEKTDEELARIAKKEKETLLKNIVITTSFGNKFDGHESARLNMSNAIQASKILGKTSNKWKLADNSIKEITLEELEEALALAIQKVGDIITGEEQ